MNATFSFSIAHFSCCRAPKVSKPKEDTTTEVPETVFKATEGVKESVVSPTAEVPVVEVQTPVEVVAPTEVVPEPKTEAVVEAVKEVVQAEEVVVKKDVVKKKKKKGGAFEI